MDALKLGDALKENLRGYLKVRDVLILGVFFWSAWLVYTWSREPSHLPAESPLSPHRVARVISPFLERNQFPQHLYVPGLGESLNIDYTIDPRCQEFVEKLLRSYQPDYGAFVALEAQTGRVLALVSYSRRHPEFGNLALMGTFPAASIFKIVTAAAAIDRQRMEPDTVISFNGGYHTLYKRNVTKNQETRWTRHLTLKEAFAKSINTIFAKVGLYHLKEDDLLNYAQRFRFNTPYSGDLPVQPGHFIEPKNDEWIRAEIASGFNRYVTMSPVQGAMMAASVANDGVLVEPYLVDSLYRDDSQILYRGKSESGSPTMSPRAAAMLREMMEETVTHGTSRRSFRGIIRKRSLSDLRTGGKTGSLTGFRPKGKYDWYVGYAILGNEKIALAALTINEEYWRVKSSYLARSFIEKYFDPRFRPINPDASGAEEIVKGK